MAVVLSGVVFGAGYGVLRLLGRNAEGAHGEGHDEGGHGEAAHGEAAHGEEPGEGAHGEAHGEAAHGEAAHGEAAHGEAAHGEHGEAPKGDPEGGHGDAHGDAGHGESAGSLHAAAGPAWEYDGSIGASRWGSLSPAFAACGNGRQQSPIDIDEAAPAPKLLPLRFHYQSTDVAFKNDGRSLVASRVSGNYVDIDGERFDLQRLEFHAPSEHKTAGVGYDMELQLVHKSAEGKVAIIGVLFDEGGENKALEKLWAALPERGETYPEPLAINPESLLPQRRLYYHYTGSLTTPPCTEGVRWFVMVGPREVSSRQMDQLKRVLAFNARPVQARNGRALVKSTR
jgi:carbonic anhydrase